MSDYCNCIHGNRARTLDGGGEVSVFVPDFACFRCGCTGRLVACPTCHKTADEYAATCMDMWHTVQSPSPIRSGIMGDSTVDILIPKAHAGTVRRRIYRGPPANAIEPPPPRTLKELFAEELDGFLRSTPSTPWTVAIAFAASVGVASVRWVKLRGRKREE